MGNLQNVCAEDGDFCSVIITSMASKNDERKQAADFFINGGLLLKDISKVLNVSPTTLSKWCDEDGWKTQKSAQNVTREKLIQQYYVMLADINKEIKEKRDGIPTSADADKIFKIQGTIAALDKKYDLGSYYTVLSELVNYINGIDINDATKLGDYMLELIKIKAAKLK